MGRCMSATKKIVKAIATELSPIGMQFIGSIVGELDATNLDNPTKRAAAIAGTKAAFVHLKIDAQENAIRMGVEAAVRALKHGQDVLANLGAADASPADLAPEA